MYGPVYLPVPSLNSPTVPVKGCAMSGATRMVGGNVALATAPVEALSKVAPVHRPGSARPRPIYAPPQVGWVKEMLRSDGYWKAHDDAATGARPGHALTLTRTISDGSKRPVKFDGLEAITRTTESSRLSMRHADEPICFSGHRLLAAHRLIGT